MEIVDYRSPSPPLPEPPKKKIKEPMTEGQIIGTVGLGFLTVFGLFFFAVIHDSNARFMHEEHDTFLQRQEICTAKNAWYEETENYHGLLACHRLDDHSLFYVVEDTGLELVPVENQ